MRRSDALPVCRGQRILDVRDAVTSDDAYQASAAVPSMNEKGRPSRAAPQSSWSAYHKEPPGAAGHPRQASPCGQPWHDILPDAPLGVGGHLPGRRRAAHASWRLAGWDRKGRPCPKANPTGPTALPMVQRLPAPPALCLPHCLSCLDCRFSSAVEQRFCKPKVRSSILLTGTK